ncbi:hypothetical protein EDL98_01535 [Ornithobacterium rhinotracheale]|uniref:hypothetical protein n=1 Tax=Ornithobacterium rhinotracheale TaxID=28251 RepID=UPI00129CAE2B|nr:hypothetical protein [Ornithobacterium rhinotracheale]MRJ09775.1 hypothetical protein [Ornithobacterium rhinotracheale]
MPIYFNPNSAASDQSSSSSSSIEEPIKPIIQRDWEISPEEKTIVWTGGEFFPDDFLVSVKLPSEEHLKSLMAQGDAENFESFWFSTYFSDNGSEYLDFGDNSYKGFVPYQKSFQYIARLKNLHRLPANELVKVKVKWQVLAKTKGMDEYTRLFVDSRDQTFYLKRIPKSVDNKPTHKFPTDLHLVFDKNKSTLTGDKKIQVPEGVTLSISDNEVLALSENVEGAVSIEAQSAISEVPANGVAHEFTISVFENRTRIHVIKVHLKLIQSEISIFNNLISGYNFCLDNNFIALEKTSSKADRVHMRLTMQFNYARRKTLEITQNYEYVYFNDKVKIYPGDEIHDFFTPIDKSFLKQSVSDLGTTNAVNVQRLMTCCIADIEIIETNAAGELLNTALLKGTHWVPGKKPAAFPYLTQGQNRRTYQGSKLTICAVAKDYTEKNLNDIVGLTDDSAIKNPYDIVQINCSRENLQDGRNDQLIVENKYISFEPYEQPDGTINVFFENQNKVTDWFTFTEVYEIQPELEFSITHNISNGKERKTDVVNKKTIKLNTGWFKQDEFPLLEDLMASSVCYIELNGEWLRAIPITKKPLAFNSVEMLHEQIVEFKLLDDAR